MRLTPNQISILQAMASGCELAWKPRYLTGVPLDLDDMGLCVDAGARDLWLGDHMIDFADHEIQNEIDDLLEDCLILELERDALNVTRFIITNMGLAYASVPLRTAA
jgi:hypothetical protein